MGSLLAAYPGFRAQTRTRPTPAAIHAAGVGTGRDVPCQGYIMSPIDMSSIFIMLISSSEIPMP